MNGLYEAAADIQGFCNQKGWDFCIIGGLALIRWGEPRQTRDVDLTILTPFGKEPQVVDALLGRFAARLHDVRSFALENRVVLVKSTNGVPIDIALGGFPFDERMVRRSSLFEFLPGVTLRTTSAEDLVVMKAFAGRPQDWIDIEHVLIRQRPDFDWGLVHTELLPLCELGEIPGNVARLDALRARIDDS